MKRKRFTLLFTVAVLVTTAQGRESAVITYEVPFSNQLHTPPATECREVRLAPSRDAPLVHGPFKPSKSYRYDTERIVVSKPGVVQVLSTAKIAVRRGDGTQTVLALKTGDRFQTSGSISLEMQDGSECVARIGGQVLQPTECLWLSGYNPKLSAGRYREMSAPGPAATWFRISDENGMPVGWCLQAWDYPED